jgi:perosamine synthetase
LINVFDPVITEADKSHVLNALNLGEISGNFSTYIEKFEKSFAEFVGVKYAATVSNGTAALQLAIAALELPTGSEILISSSTNIATALAVIHNNLIPVPVDSEIETWNLCLEDLESKITPLTKAIIPVHLFGHPVDMEKLNLIALKYNLIVIEDCAESHGATVNGKMTGSFGDMACFSFYANKILTTGEGGMVVTDNEGLYNKIKSYRNLGFKNPRFVHDIAAFNFRMTGYQAALGFSQLNRVDEILEAKINLGNTYNNLFAHNQTIQVQGEKSWAKNVYWMYGVLVKESSLNSRDELTKKLFERGIDTRTFFCPMDMQPILKTKYGIWNENTIASDLWRNGFYLPSSINLSKDTLNKIAENVNELTMG